MVIINRARQTGKTTMLIHTACITKTPILVRGYSQKEFTLEKAKKMNCKVDVYTLNEWIEKEMYAYRPTTRKVLIDEAESIIEEALMRTLGAEVEAITFSIPMTE